MTEPFSRRHGFAPPRTLLQPWDMPHGLRNRLWSAVLQGIQGWWSNRSRLLPMPAPNAEWFWDSFLKRALDEMPRTPDRYEGELRSVFFTAPWWTVYDFLEWIGQNDEAQPDDSLFMLRVNVVLEEELAAWRFVGRTLQPVTEAHELDAIAQATESPVEPIRRHIGAALTCLGRRPEADTRNAMKESVSAVEAAAQFVTGQGSDAYSRLTKKLEEAGAHPQFVAAWKNLFNYTSDAGGVRHAGKEGEPPPTVDEAKLFVITASAFVNYLVARPELVE